MLAEIDRLIPEADGSDEDSVFRGVEEALRHAFTNSARSAPADSLARHQKRGREAVMTREERAAEAGNVRRRIEADVHGARYYMLVAKFAPRSFPCNCGRSCCSKRAWNHEWEESVRLLAEKSVEALSGEISNRQLRSGAIRKWAGGEKVHMGDLADKCGVHRNTAGKHAKLVSIWLDTNLAHAVNEAYAALRKCGAL